MMNINDTERKIWNTLLEGGYDTYIVGGAVRDYLLGHDSSDIDFATIATPEEISELFKNTDFKLNFVGASFGVTIINGVEVATFRGDVYGGNGDKDVDITYLDNIEDDLARRDFTVNAIAYDIDGNLIDPFNGRRDIEKRIIRFVGEPIDRINEDPNRILRALRFAARFNFAIHLDTALAIKVNNHKVNMIAPERIRLEILKTLETTQKASVFWKFMLDAGILEYVFPELATCWKHDHGNHHDEDVWVHNMLAGDYIECINPLLKLAAYLHDVGKPAAFDPELGTFYEHQHFGADIVRKRLTNLKFSNDEIRYVVNLVLIHMDGTRNMSNKSRRRLKNKMAAYGIHWNEYLAIRIADRHANLSRPDFTSDQIADYVEMLTTEEEIPFSTHDLAISGGDIIEMFDLDPGPLVGRIQRELLKYVIDNGDSYNNIHDLVNIIKDEFNLNIVNEDKIPIN